MQHDIVSGFKILQASGFEIFVWVEGTSAAIEAIMLAGRSMLATWTSPVVMALAMRSVQSFDRDAHTSVHAVAATNVVLAAEVVTAYAGPLLSTAAKRFTSDLDA
jgi:hypothetical protein